MRHFTLTCRNHPDLRWMTKSIAWSSRSTEQDPRAGYYNQSRNIFFLGTYDPATGECDHSHKECSCSANMLILAPEETGIDEGEKATSGYTAEGRPI